MLADYDKMKARVQRDLLKWAQSTTPGRWVVSILN
jgi:hypothetical protein